MSTVAPLSGKLIARFIGWALFLFLALGISARVESRLVAQSVRQHSEEIARMLISAEDWAKQNPQTWKRACRDILTSRYMVRGITACLLAGLIVWFSKPREANFPPGDQIHTATAKRFDTDYKLRRLHVLGLGLAITAASCAAYFLVPFALGGHLSAISPLTAALIFGLPWWVCYIRIKWGTAVVLDQSALILEKHGTVLRKIPRNWIVEVHCKERVLVFKHLTDAGTIKPMVLGREGFSKDIWNDLCQHLKALPRRAGAVS